jgi:molybdenum cofactor biosynthesis enzyme MoaA
MTGIKGLSSNAGKVNWGNFNKAARLASLSGVATVLITGKGEPLLYPKMITEYLEHLKKYDFPLIELQTNGLLLDYKFEKYKEYLNKWHDLGLGLVAVSIVHYDPAKNKAIYTPRRKYINLPRLAKRLHDLNLSVRLSCTMTKGFIDSPKEVQKLAAFANGIGVEQLSLRPVTRPLSSENKKTFDWVGENCLVNKSILKIRDFLDKNGHRLITYGHGSIIYDLNDQNVCLTNALTIKPETNDIRQLIFFPDGHLRFDWQFKGGVIL